MGLFNFKKKKEKDILLNNLFDIDVKKEEAENTKLCKKFNLLCMNFGVNDFSFTLTANETGKIIINKSMSKKEYNNVSLATEICNIIEDNIMAIKDFSGKKNGDSKENNMFQVEFEGEKYTLFRNNVEDEMTMFYDRMIVSLSEVLNLKKSYENIELDFTFEYPGDWDKIKGDIDKYCLLSNSKPVVVFMDSNNDYVTLEYIDLKSGIVDKIIASISNSDDYNVIKTFDYEKNGFNSKFLLLNYDEIKKIELFAFIELKDICIIMTGVIGKSEDFDISDLEQNQKFKKLLSTVETLKTLTGEDIINN